MTVLKYRLEGEKELLQNIDKLKRNIVASVKKIINVNSLLLQTHIRTDLIKFNSALFSGGTSDNTLSSRTGQLKRSISVIPTAVNDSGDISSGLNFGARYAGVHIGPQGKTTVIKPKNGKFLAIPLPAAQGANGQAKGGPRDKSLWGDTFIARSKRGNPVILGYNKYMKGARAGENKGSITPLFVLLKSVTVKTRIFPEDLIKWVQPKIENDLKDAEKTWLA